MKMRALAVISLLTLGLLATACTRQAWNSVTRSAVSEFCLRCRLTFPPMLRWRFAQL